MRKLSVLFTLVGASLFLATAAQAFPAGPDGKPIAPTVTCDTILIDPASWLKVTFTGTIGGKAYSRTAFYIGEGQHNAQIAIKDLTTAFGPITITSTATGPFLGTSSTATVTLTCHKPPVTTTSSSSTTSTTKATTTTAPTTTTTVFHRELPRTGSHDGQYAVWGGSAVLLGAAAAFGARKRRG